MSFYAIASVVASAGGDGGAVVGQAAATGMVAIPLSELAWPVRAGVGGDGRSALVVGGCAPIRTGVAVAWCKIVAVAPAVVRRDGRVQADGRPCDHARLGRSRNWTAAVGRGRSSGSPRGSGRPGRSRPWRGGR